MVLHLAVVGNQPHGTSCCFKKQRDVWRNIDNFENVTVEIATLILNCETSTSPRANPKGFSHQPERRSGRIGARIWLPAVSQQGIFNFFFAGRY
jgi:hypothetical protein